MSVFDTRVKFYHLFSSSFDRELHSTPGSMRSGLLLPGDRDKAITAITNAPLKQWVIEQFSGYFHPMSNQVFLAFGYNGTKHELEGIFQKSNQRSLLATVLKIISYFSLIITLFVGVILSYAQTPLVIRSVSIPLSPPSPIRAEPSPPKHIGDHEEDRVNSHSTPLRGRIGGEVTLNERKIWISFKNHPTHENSTILQINSIDLMEDESSLLIAKVTLELQKDQVIFRELYLNNKHLYFLSACSPRREYAFKNFDEAPDELNEALIPLAGCVFYAVVRWYISTHKSMDYRNSVSQEGSDSDNSSEVCDFPLTPHTDTFLLFQSTPTRHSISTPTAPLFPCTPLLLPSQRTYVANSRHSMVSRKRSRLKIIIEGKLATLLTQDGPERIVDDRYKVQQELPCLHVNPLPYMQAAFNAMKSPSISLKQPATTRLFSFSDKQI